MSSKNINWLFFALLVFVSYHYAGWVSDANDDNPSGLYVDYQGGNWVVAYDWCEEDYGCDTDWVYILNSKAQAERALRDENDEIRESARSKDILGISELPTPVRWLVGLGWFFGLFYLAGRIQRAHDLEE